MPRNRPASVVVLIALALVISGGGQTSAVASSQARPAALEPCRTTVGGPIFADTTWSLANSPYCATSSVWIMPGITLTVEPGVVVRFNAGKAMDVEGALIARGSESSRIVFTSNREAPAPGDWGYIRFADSSVDATFDESDVYTGGSVVQRAVVEYAGGASVSPNAALRLSAASPWIDRSRIASNLASGIWAWGGASPRVTGNTVSGNSGNGVVVDSASGSVLIADNTVTGNSGVTYGGGILATSARAVTITGNAVTGNSGVQYGGGIYASGATITGNTVNGNAVSGWDAAGGGIYSSGTSTISGNAVSSNNASGGATSYGGGIFGSGTITGNTVVDNTAYSSSSVEVRAYGGGIFGSGTVTGNTVSRNTANSSGN